MVYENREDVAAVGGRQRQDSLQPQAVGGLSDGLAGAAIVALDASSVQAHRVERFGVPQIENGFQAHLKPMQVAGQEVLGSEPLPGREPAELRDGRISGERQIEGRKAPGRVPAPAPDPRPRRGERVVPGRHVTERVSFVSGRAGSADSLGEVLHRLYEDALRERVYRPEDRTEVPALEKLDRLVIVELGIRREQPVVRR